MPHVIFRIIRGWMSVVTPINPIEPIHVHIAEGKASANATKVWITSSGKTLLCNNHSHIPEKTLRNILRLIEANSNAIVKRWYDQFGEIKYYC